MLYIRQWLILHASSSSWFSSVLSVFSVPPCWVETLKRSALGVPVAFEVGNQGGAEMAVGLLQSVGGGVAAGKGERVPRPPGRAAGRGGPDDAGARGGGGKAVGLGL